MTPPSEAVLETLAVLRVGVEFVAHEGTGQMCVVRRDGAAILVGDELDELVERGWVATEDDSVTVTSAGCYALQRWLRRTGRELDYGEVL